MAYDEKFSQVYTDEPEAEEVVKKEVAEVEETEDEFDEHQDDVGDTDDGEGDGEADEAEYSAAETAAMAKGWKPEGVKGKRALSADEFNDRESFYERIHRLEKTNEGLRGTVDEMASQHQKIAEIEREKAMDELKERKKQALAEEDYDTVIDLDDRIAESREVPVQKGHVQEETTEDPAYASWAARNTWYNQAEDPGLYEEATTLGFAYKNRNPNKSSEEVFDYVENTIKRMYPDQFERPARRGAKVEGSRSASPRKRGGPKKHTKRDLNDNQRRVMNTYVKRGVMTEDEYISELAKIGELG